MLNMHLFRVREILRVADAALKEEEVSTDFPNQTATIIREPYGVILAITPWNAPLVLAARGVTDSIISGNTVVLKTSEYSPTSNSTISQLFQEAGLPAGVLNVVHASAKDAPSVVESMIANPLVRRAAVLSSDFIFSNL